MPMLDRFNRWTFNSPDSNGSDLAQPTEMEVILIVRSTKDPTHAEAITLTDPSPKLLKYLERLGNQQAGESRIDMAQLRQQIVPANQRNGKLRLAQFGDETRQTKLGELIRREKN